MSTLEGSRRVAGKELSCDCSAARRATSIARCPVHPECQIVITPGSVYVEAPAGVRDPVGAAFCEPCGLAVWAVS